MTNTPTPDSIKGLRSHDHETIYLQPWCEGCQKNCYEGREWCETDIWDGCEGDGCERKSVKYVRADIIERLVYEVGQPRRQIESSRVAESVPLSDPFGGYGIALRRETDPPIPGEPLMSMADARRIAAEMVAAAVSDRLSFPAGANGDNARSIIERIQRTPQSRERCGREPCTFCDLNAEFASMILEAANPQTDAAAQGECK